MPVQLIAYTDETFHQLPEAGRACKNTLINEDSC
jgi:hypothetical protein